MPSFQGLRWVRAELGAAVSAEVEAGLASHRGAKRFAKRKGLEFEGFLDEF